MTRARCVHLVPLASILLLLAALPAGLSAQSAPATAVKYVYAVDYPLGQKANYLGWVASVANRLQAPDEILRIASYDNYFSASPHRLIEFEFAGIPESATYFGRPEIKSVLDELVNRGMNTEMMVLERRGDYAPPASSGAIRYLYTVEYPLGQKADYLAWVATIAEKLQAPPELRRIVSWDNFFGAKPDRVIEFEFDDLESAARYFSRPEIQAVLEDAVNHGLNGRMSVLSLRSDYAPR